MDRSDGCRHRHADLRASLVRLEGTPMKKLLPILLVLASGTLLANGESFFVPALRGPVNLVYFARVKNSRTGRPIEKPPYVTIVDPYTGLIMPFVGDSPGHFRSPDVGAAIKEITTH